MPVPFKHDQRAHSVVEPLQPHGVHVRRHVAQQLTPQKLPTSRALHGQLRLELVNLLQLFLLFVGLDAVGVERDGGLDEEEVVDDLVHVVLGGLRDLGENVGEVGGVGGDEDRGEVREDLPGEPLVLEETNKIKFRKWDKKMKPLCSHPKDINFMLELTRVKIDEFIDFMSAIIHKIFLDRTFGHNVACGVTFFLIKGTEIDQSVTYLLFTGLG